METAQARFSAFKAIWGRWFRWVFYIWALISFWDTFAQQILQGFLPNEPPTVFQVVAMTSGWLPWWGWLLVVALAFAIACFEYAARVGRTSTPSGDGAKQRELFDLAQGCVRVVQARLDYVTRAILGTVSVATWHGKLSGQTIEVTDVVKS